MEKPAISARGTRSWTKRSRLKRRSGFGGSKAGNIGQIRLVIQGQMLKGQFCLHNLVDYRTPDCKTVWVPAWKSLIRQQVP